MRAGVAYLAVRICTCIYPTRTFEGKNCSFVQGICEQVNTHPNTNLRHSSHIESFKQRANILRNESFARPITCTITRHSIVASPTPS